MRYVEVPIHNKIHYLSSLDNYELLSMLGLIEDTGEFVMLSSDAVVLKDQDIPEFDGLPKVFTLDKLFTEKFFKPEELRKALDEASYLKHLRVFIPHFRQQDNGIITQKADNWDKFKAWRFDIDFNYPIDHIFDLIQKLPLPPNIVKKSKRGWHLIYVFDEFITREAYELYLNRFNNFSKEKPDDKVYLQFMVYELLTNYIPLYLKEIEPDLDLQASSKISFIGTRFVSEDLPAYCLKDAYSLNEFYKAFEHITKETFYYEDDKSSPYTIHDIPKETFYSLLSRCGVIRALDEDWENHSYYDWFVMFNYYAIKILYADTPEEASKLREEFHEKSRRYRDYDYASAEYQLDYAIKKHSQGLKPPGCRFVYQNVSPKYTKICETCPYKKVDKRTGEIFGHFIFDALKRESLETIPLKGWELREDGWYYYGGNSENVVRVLPYFKIQTHYIIGDEEVEYVEIVDKQGRFHTKKIDRKKDTYMPTLEFVKSFGYINPDKVKEAKRFLAHYIEKVKEQRGVKIDFLGYRYINGFWDVIVGGDGNYRRNELGFIFYGKELEHNSDWFIPSVRGTQEKFKELYRKAFELNDPPLHFALAHYLSWIGKQFINRGVKPNINPVLIFVGDTGTGKSIRAKISAGLYGNPSLFSFTNITQASFNNNFPLIKTPFGIDEVIVKTEKDETKFGELIYNITNIQGRMTYNTTYNPIDVPVLITGETENLLTDKVFANYRGLNRRSIIIEMTTDWKHNSDTLDYILEELYSHHGYILSYVKSLSETDKAWIEEVSERIYNNLQFGDSSFKDLRKHIALSLAMLGHFFHHFIGIDTKEINEKISRTINFVIKQINQNQVSRVGENIDYAEEVMEFISKVIEAQNNKIELRGLSYKQVCNKLGYTPSHKVGQILKKFFWKSYRVPNGTRLVFSTSILLNYPASFGGKLETNAIEVANDKSRIHDFTKEELRIWLEVLKLRYGEERYNKVIEALELDKVPTFRKALNLINEQDNALIHFKDKPQEEAEKQPQDSKAKVIPIDKAVEQNEAKETQPTSKTDRRKEAKQKEPKTIEISAEFETKVIFCAEVGRRFNPFTRNILKNGAQETDTNKVRQAEPTYPYPEHNEDENIVAMLEEEREWIRRNLRSINDDF
jgi:hypothetical protein